MMMVLLPSPQWGPLWAGSRDWRWRATPSITPYPFFPFFVLNCWSNKLGFTYTDKKQWDSSAYQDDTLNTNDSLNDHMGIAAYPCSVVSVQEPVYKSFLIFVVSGLSMSSWKFGKYLSWIKIASSKSFLNWLFLRLKPHLKRHSN